MKTKKAIKSKSVPIIIGVFGALMLAPILAVLFVYQLYGSISLGGSTPQKVEAQTDKSIQPVITNAPINILLLGYGGGDHDGGKLTDTLILAQVDPQAKKISLISIPRDVWVKIPISDTATQNYKVNAAYALGHDEYFQAKLPEKYQGVNGGGELSKDAIATITGIKADYYLAIGFDGFTSLLGKLGPLEVDVPVAFTDEFYPIKGMETDPCGKTDEEIKQLMLTYRDFELEKQFTCRFERITFAKGIQSMDANTALKFVRSRHSTEHGNDFSRSQRQQALIEAVKVKVLSLNFLAKVVPILQEVPKYIETDIDFSAVRLLYGYYQQMKDLKLHSIQLSTDNVLKHATSPNRAYILISTLGMDQWSNVHEFVKNSIAANTATENQ